MTAIIGLLIGLLLPAVQAAREAGRRTQCASHLRQIALALHSYNDAMGKLPPARQGGLASAFICVLPYLEQGSSFAQYNFRLHYSDPANAAVINQRVPVYLCPSMVLPRIVPDPDPTRGEYGAPASYAVNTGSNYAFLTQQHNGAIVHTDSGSTSIGLINGADGTSHTLLVGELDYGLENYYWEGIDPPEVRGGATRWASGYPGVTWGSTYGVFNADRLINGYNEFVTFRSDHSGGANFAYADGSVHFTSDAINPQALNALATRNGREVIETP